MSTARLDRSVAPVPGPLRPFHFPSIERSALTNDRPVLFCRTEGLPVATFSLLLPAGALRERPGESGLATLTGALLESGTTKRDAAGIAEKLESLGVNLHVGTSWEVTHVDFTVLPERAVEAAEVVAELVRAPTFPESEVERIRQAQLAGILQRRADPRGLANEMASRFIFSEDTPFARSLTGTQQSVAALSREHVARFHERNFTPHGATLVVAGNISAEEAHATSEMAFGNWTGHPITTEDVRVEPRSTSIEVIVVERPGAVQSEIRIGHVGVSRRTPDYFPLLVMNTVLGGAFSSRLNLNLREKHGFTYGVHSSFVMRNAPGPFLVSTAVQTEVTGAAVREILNELRRIREDETTPEELSDARQYVAGTFPLRMQTTDGIVSRLAELAIFDLPDSYLEEFADRILAVQADEVIAAARNHVHPERLTILVVGDAEIVKSQLEELELGELTVVAPASE